MKTTTLASIVALGALAIPAHAAFWLDFNSNQANGGTPVPGDPGDPTNAVHNQAGYQSYHASHEVAAGFVLASYNTSFALTGPASVTVLPSWPNTTANTVQQMIGRSDGQAGSWLGNDQLLLREWIGVDSRGGNNGGWDGTTGTPTYITITLGGLAAADYALRSFHHDVENMCAFFTTEISVDGGATYSSPVTGRMTNSLAGGTPAENEVLPGEGVNVAGGDPADLTSTQNFVFTANGTDDVVVRYAPLSPGTNTTHLEFFGVNGFQLEQIPEPGVGVLAVFGAGILGLRRRR